MRINLIAKKLVSDLYDYNKRYLLVRKIRSIASVQGRKRVLLKPPQEQIASHLNLWGKFNKKVNLTWIKVYGNISGIWDHRYVPETLYYTIIEPCLNDKSFSKAYTDKNFCPVILNGFIGPDIIISNINGLFYNCKNEQKDINAVTELLLKADKFIIKPATDSGGGKGVSLMTREDGNFVSEAGIHLSLEELLMKYGKNYVIQEVVLQHSWYEKYNDTSLNTVRVLTYRSISDNRIYVLHSVLRVGRRGKITDNQASGGYACGLTDDGLLTGIAVDKYGNVYEEVNGVNLVKGEKPEGIDLIRRKATEIADRFPYSRLMGLDLCLDNEGQCRVIEVNNINNEINFFQMTGGPLFGEFTDEVISYSLSHKRSFMIDFEI